MTYNPFTIDDDEVIMTLSQALSLVPDEDPDQPTEESEHIMATKKVAAKSVPAKAVAKAAPAAKKAVGAPKGARTVPEGYIGLNDLATELGMKPAAIRRKLRATDGIAKPDGEFGWKWKEGSKELTSVRKALEPAPAA